MNRLEIPPLIKIRSLRLERGRTTVLQIQNLDIFSGETLAVIGPNGAGKSSLLLCLARLLNIKNGEMYFDGQVLDTLDVLAYRRKIALVLQEPLLLDRTVFDNVAAPLRFRRLPREEIAKRVDGWLERLGISHLRSRPARQISGGEAQRTSLARALSIQPKLLLLDEPFSALDTPTRQRLLQDMRSLLAETEVATVFVTHDQDEALTLGDRVAVILDGSLRQVGSPNEVFSTPHDEDIASFVGVETVLPGTVNAVKDGQVTVFVHGVPIHAIGEFKCDQQVLVCLRPEDITLWQDGSLPSSSARNQLHGKVLSTSPLGPLVRVEVACGLKPAVLSSLTNVVALVTRHSADELNLKPGLEVLVTFKASAVHIITR